MEMVAIVLELPDAEALALSQLVKRLCWNELRDNAVDNDEAFLMREAINKVAQGLARVGSSPR